MQCGHQQGKCHRPDNVPQAIRSVAYTAQMIPPATVMPHDPATSLRLNGWISEYSAQGMEGEVWRIFQDKRYA
jgi:hypothetical protein